MNLSSYIILLTPETFLHKLMNKVKTMKSIYDNIKTEYIIIDEISMVSEMVYKFFPLPH